jgi:hypothetical protein
MSYHRPNRSASQRVSYLRRMSILATSLGPVTAVPISVAAPRRSASGILVNASYFGGDGAMYRGDGKAVRFLFMTMSDLLFTHFGAKFAIPNILTNDMVKHAACAAPSSSSGLVPGFSP